jgi:MarR family transcriptional regulator, organic hydroperoxide resistance regulator
MAETGDDYSRSMGGQALAARLRRISERLDRDGTRLYAEHDVVFEQRWYGVLRQLTARGPMSVGEIAAALRISHASVSEARRSMEKAGIISARSAPADKRKRTLHLTAEGEKLCARLGPMWDAFNKVAAELNAEAGDVVALLDRLDDALDRRSMHDRILDRLDET